MQKFLFKISLIGLSLLFSISSFCQTWDFVLDTIHSMGRQVILTSDSCYMVTSKSSDFDNGLSLKVSQNGDVLWVTPHGGSSIQQTHDDGYIIAGGYNYTDAFLKKLDSDGNIVWNKFYGGSGQSNFRSVIQTTDLGFVACGFSRGYGDSTLFVVKVDSFGSLLWQRNFSSGNGTGNAIDLIEFNNHYYIVGKYYVNDSEHYLFVVKLKSNGSTVWRKDYQLGLSGLSVALTNDSSLIIAGFSNLTKLDLNGDLIWSKYLNNYWDIHSVDVTVDNGFILSGSQTCNIFYEENLLVKLDSSGNTQWSRTYPTGQEASPMAFSSVKSTISNGYISCGYSHYDFSQLRIIKTNATGGFLGNFDFFINNNEVKIFPNPTFGKVKIDVKNIKCIEVYNMTGIKIISNEKSNLINLSGQPEGVYLVVITSKKGKYLKKIIKQ